MTPTGDQWLQRLSTDYQICLQQMDVATNRGLLVLLDENAYRNASFLDQRALAHNPPGQWASLDDIWRSINTNASPHYIFHIGHCGSTLISRLLDEVGGFGLREPLPLRSMAEAEAELDAPWSLFSPAAFDAALARLNGLWDRRPPSAGQPIVKATSQCSGLASRILGQSVSSRALTLGLKPERFLATVLAGQYAPFEFRAAAPLRLKRLARLGVNGLPSAHSLETPQYAALAWLTETLVARQLQATDAQRVLHIDFDEFLDAPADVLGRIASHFDLNATSEQISTAINGPVMSRYSKAPEHGYSTNVRDQLVAKSSVQHERAIRDAISWLKDWVANDAILSTHMEPLL
ncbi:MAG: hypothetical protein DHS20C06_05240 [Hyphobacterium sp.]|nr:MAG: hypothetical protein DHS20C06_05240 [Hyphobacterium sp.]